MRFELYYNPEDPTSDGVATIVNDDAVVPVPTLSPLGGALLAVVLASFGAFVLRRRRSVER